MKKINSQKKDESPVIPGFEGIKNELDIRIVKYDSLKSTLNDFADHIGILHKISSLKDDEQILVNSQGAQVLIRVGDIKYITESEEENFIFISDSYHAIVNKTTYDWKNLLPEDHFFNIGKSIINLSYVQSISQSVNDSINISFSEISNPLILAP